MYADTISPAMQATIDETQRRREIQGAYNKEHGITPTTIEKAVRDSLEITKKIKDEIDNYKGKSPLELTKKELSSYASLLEKEMKEAARDLQFERAALLRDRLLEIRSCL